METQVNNFNLVDTGRRSLSAEPKWSAWKSFLDKRDHEETACLRHSRSVRKVGKEQANWLVANTLNCTAFFLLLYFKF